MAKPRTMEIGSVRTNNGQTEIYVKGWLPYPEQASDLIKLAYEHGWAVDDGLPSFPTGRDYLKVYEDGYPSIRVLIARPYGRQARSLDGAPAIQFHITWHASNDAWNLSTVYRKENNGHWQDSRIQTVSANIVKYALRLPSIYAQANH